MRVSGERRGWLALVTWLAFVTSATWSMAFDAQEFSPAIDADGYFSIYSSRTAPAGRYHVAAWYDYASDVVDLAGQGRVDRVHTIDLAGAYSLLDWLTLGMDLPISSVSSDLADVPEGFGVDDLRIVAKVNPLAGRDSMFGLALIPFVDAPTGDHERLTANHGTNFGVLGVFDVGVERFRASLNLGYRVAAGSASDVDEMLFGLGVAYAIVDHPASSSPRSFFAPRRLEAIGAIFGSTSVSDAFSSEFVTPLEGLGGLRLASEAGLFLQVGAGSSFTDSINGPSVRVVSAIGYAPPPAPSIVAPPPAPPAVPMAKVVVTDEQVIPLEPIRFESSSATIFPRSFDTLDEIAHVLVERPGLRVRIEGHTDSSGLERKNRELSELRAQLVREYLIERGVPRERLEFTGYGSSRPVASNDTPQGRALNRRTEFHVIR